MYRKLIRHPPEQDPQHAGTGADTGRSRDRWILYYPALVFTLCAAWYECMPVYPGYVLCVFAVIGVILLTRANRSSITERSVWGVLAVMALIGEAATGYGAHRQARTFLTCSFAQPGTASLALHGDTPLRSVSMLIADQRQIDQLKASRSENGIDWARTYHSYSVGLLEPQLHRTYPMSPLHVYDGTAHYRVQFFTEAGYSWEDFQSVLVHGHNAQAYRVVRYMEAKPSVQYEQADADFPRSGDQKVDWSWALLPP